MRQVQGNSNLVRIYVKGAPEYVIALCTQSLNNQVKPVPFGENDQLNILQHVVSQSMAAHGMKTLTYAFKEISVDDLNQLTSHYNVEQEEFRNELENDLIYLGTFGMDDPLRTDIDQSIKYIRYGSLESDENEGNQVNIRMVSGDHIDSAKIVALRTGIIKQEEMHLNGIAMTGDQFRQEIGDYTKIWDP